MMIYVIPVPENAMNLIARMMNKRRIDCNHLGAILFCGQILANPVQPLLSKLIMRPGAISHEMMKTVIIRVAKQLLLNAR